MREDFTAVSPKSLSAIAARLGRTLPLKERLLMKYRPYICPFHLLLPQVPPGSRLLDIGCGNGLWLLLLSELGRLSAGTGMDITQPKIEVARQLASKFPFLSFTYQTPEQPFPAGNFDCISAIDVLHHVPPSHQLEFLERLAGSAGTIIFKDINPAARLCACMNTLHDLLLSQQLPRYCAPEKVIEHLSKLGFKVVHRENIRMVWYSHYLLVFRRSP